MVFVHSRITSEDDVVLNSVILWIRANAKCILAVQEVSKEGKKHIHVMAEISLSISRFGDKLRIQFPKLKGNGSHSTKEFKESYDHNLRYLCKGTKESLPLVLFTNLEESVIEDAHKRFWEEQKKWLTEHGVKPEEKVTKKKPMSFVEKVARSLDQGAAEEYVKLQYHQWTSNLDVVGKRQYEDIRQVIAQHCILNLGQAFKTLDDSIVRKLINGVLNSIVTMYGNKSEREAYQNRLWSRTFNDVY